MKAGIRRLQRALQGFSHFNHGELLELVKDEDGPLFVVQLIQDLRKLLHRLTAGELFVLLWRLGHSRRLCRGNLADDTSATSVISSHPHTDAVDPGFD